MKKVVNKPTKGLDKDEKIKRLRDRLIEVCDAHVKSGKKVIAGHFQDTSIDGCCPIACLTGTPTGKDDYSDVAQKRLKFGFTAEDMWAFIDGFDGNNKTSRFAGSPEFKLGRELRRKYIKPASKKSKKGKK